jgi:hypothetical protein
MFAFYYVCLRFCPSYFFNIVKIRLVHFVASGGAMAFVLGKYARLVFVVCSSELVLILCPELHVLFMKEFFAETLRLLFFNNFLADQQNYSSHTYIGTFVRVHTRHLLL